MPNGFEEMINEEVPTSPYPVQAVGRTPTGAAGGAPMGAEAPSPINPLVRYLQDLWGTVKGLGGEQPGTKMEQMDPKSAKEYKERVEKILIGEVDDETFRRRLQGLFGQGVIDQEDMQRIMTERKGRLTKQAAAEDVEQIDREAAESMQNEAMEEKLRQLLPIISQLQQGTYGQEPGEAEPAEPQPRGFFNMLLGR